MRTAPLSTAETVGLWALALVFAVACAFLGRWQWHRYEAKHEKSDLVERNTAARVVPLEELLRPPARGGPTTFDPQLTYRRVEVAGRYDVDRTLLVRNRPHDGGTGQPTYGYEVLVPLTTADGTTVVVDRGWIPGGTQGDRPGDRPDAVPAAPGGDVRVTVMLRRGEPPRAGTLPAGQLATIDLPEVARLAGLPTGSASPLVPAYGALLTEQPGPATAPAPLDPPEVDGGEGVNFSYAVQWLLFATLGLGFPLWLRRHRLRLAADRLEAADTVDGDPAPAPRPARPRRRRIWDADDEDDLGQ
ncbi:hypothetical protein GCM10028814_21000 [Angustibacter aerolatus]